MTERKGSSTLSKKRYQDLEIELYKRFATDVVDEMLTVLKYVMMFDPEKSTYSKEKGEKEGQRRRDKAKEIGVSLYVLLGQDKQYAMKKMGHALKDNPSVNTIVNGLSQGGDVQS